MTTASTRKVDLGGIYNVRDLGGFPGTDGRRVRRGMLFRSSSLHRLGDADAWREFGARCVVDLRYDRERDAFPLPDFITNDTHAPLLPNHWRSDAEAKKGKPETFLSGVFQDMLELGGPSVREILHALADADSYPAVFFCMAGKDRTGVLAAILLSLLGVSEADIVADFELSGSEVIALVDHLRSREDFEDHPMMNQPVEHLRAPRGAMELFLAEVDVKYGGLPGYVRSLNVDEATVETLRELLLEEA
ncbi:MAG: protein-tyrosine-phosphatase [Actinomycetales bacterium]|nr:protein-tyrosine-phosphatase [Actinomycetales bacterium]